jgi:hypothetical protein
MAEVIKRGEFSNRAYRFLISGNEPTVDEQSRIDQILREKEFGFAKDYEAKYGQALTSEGEGVANYLGEIPKGIARGAVGMFESALLGGAAALPEQYEAPVREGIRSIAYGYKPQADVGMEGTVGGTFGEALGSFGALGLTSLIPGGQFAAPALAVGAAPLRRWVSRVASGDCSIRIRMMTPDLTTRLNSGEKPEIRMPVFMA